MITFKMPETKTYLNVPYAEKDAAKGLGARWDAAVKKWYVPANLDCTLFAKWHSISEISAENALNTAKQPNSTLKNTATLGVFTQPSIPNFIAYDGDEPPWN